MIIEFIVLNKETKAPLTEQLPPIDGDLVEVIKKSGSGKVTSKSRKTYTAEQYEEKQTNNGD